MKTHLDITFRGMAPSASVEDAIHRWVARLDHIYDRIHSCSVIIEQPHLRQRQGNLFHVHVTLRVPGRDIAVSREPARNPEHESVYGALADAFRAARRRLQGHAQRQVA